MKITLPSSGWGTTRVIINGEMQSNSASFEIAPGDKFCYLVFLALPAYITYVKPTYCGLQFITYNGTYGYINISDTNKERLKNAV